MANIYLKDGRIPTESKDCSVIALSYAFNIDYSNAHDICKKAGRKNNRPFSLFKVFGFHKMTNGRIINGKTVIYNFRPKMTVGRFRNTYNKGTYIIRVAGHIFTIIDGVIFNNLNDRRIVSFYYEIVTK